MLNRAQITAGATQGSQTVTVSLLASNETLVLVYRGELLLGYAPLDNGTATVALSVGLATGDIIQAHVTEQGNQCGLPVKVVPTGIQLNGWKTPTEIEIVLPDGEVLLLSASVFKETYGFLPASIYDPSGLSASVQPEWVQPTASAIFFDVLTERQSNQTTITVQNVQFAKGGTLVRWTVGGVAGGWSNSLSQVVGTAGTVVVDVRGEDDDETRYASKTLAITITTVPTTPVPDARIKGQIWRDFGNGTVRLEVNTRDNIEGRINGGGWVGLDTYGLDYRECLFFGVSDGANEINIRVSGEANPAKWVTINFVKGY